MTKPKRAEKPAKGKAQTITVPVVDTDSREKTELALAEHIAGWAELSKLDKAELTELVFAQRRKSEPVKVKLIPKKEGGYSIELAGKSDVLAALKLHKAFGTNSLDCVNARANELLRYLGSIGACNDSRYNAALAFIESMNPHDQAEALLLVQMYVTHDAAVRALTQLGSVEWVPQMQTFGNLAVKLLRTSQGQMEALARMRRGGEQVVRHIHVDNRGGQAVIAENVHTGGQGNGKIDGQSHAATAGAFGSSATLPCSDSLGSGVPISGRESQAKMQDARRDQPGSSNGQSKRMEARRPIG